MRDASSQLLLSGFALLPLFLRALERFELVALALRFCGLTVAIDALHLTEAAADGTSGHALLEYGARLGLQPWQVGAPHYGMGLLVQH